MIETIGSRLKSLRMNEQLSQQQVANLIGVNKTAISYYETDERQPPLGTLVHLANIFGVTTDYILGREKERPLDMQGLSVEDKEILRYVIARMAEANKPK